MKIEIKENTIEEALVKRAKDVLGYSTHTEFINDAVFFFYQKKIEEQVEIAGKYRVNEDCESQQA